MKMVVWLGKGMLYGNVPCTYVHAVYIYMHISMSKSIHTGSTYFLAQYILYS